MLYTCVQTFDVTSERGNILGLHEHTLVEGTGDKYREKKNKSYFLNGTFLSARATK
jgi:hypothetical protein